MNALLLLAALWAAAAGPTIESVSPAAPRLGGGDFIVRVRGRGFTTSTVLRWNGSDRITAVVAPDLLTAMIPGSDVTSPGEARLTLYDPDSGSSPPFPVIVRGGASVGNTGARAAAPRPKIRGLFPRAVTAGSRAATLRVSGEGFTALSVVRVGGAARPTRLVRPGVLETTLQPADLATARERSVTVRNPLPGGGVSEVFPLEVEAAPAAALERPSVHPNPWRADVHPEPAVRFENLSRRSVVVIYRRDGTRVKTIQAARGAGRWDLTDQAGSPVGGGSYVYRITDGRRTVEGKLAVSR